MINYSGLFCELDAYKVTKDADMPRVYQRANPAGRPLHDDWPWPFSRIPRMSTAFLAPMPFRLVSFKGPVCGRWMPWQEGYPEAPEAIFRPALPGSEAHARGCLREAFAYDPVLPVGQEASFAAFLGGRWVECYYTKTTSFLGRRLHTNHGLKPDLTLGDFCCWLEGSLTWTKLVGG